MNTLENIKIKIAEIEEKKQSMLAELQKEFPSILAPFFEANTSIQSIGWSQYTPYFNDGEECVFSTNIDMDYGLRINGEGIDDSSLLTISLYSAPKFLAKDGSYERWIEKYPDDAIDPIKDADQLALYLSIKEIVDTLSSIPDEFYKSLFGDHVEVTINRDGSVEKEEYEHD